MTEDELNIVQLGGAAPCPADEYGWKASRLHDLLISGINALDGFAIGAQEHLKHLHARHLGESAAASQVSKSSLDEPMLRALEDATRGFAAPMAVRSSALREDQPFNSSAGKYLSVLNVERAELGTAVIQVWASAHREEAPGEVGFTPMGIIVQPMLRGDAYGVASSAEPVTGERLVVVELGAAPTAVTSGHGVAERYEVYSDASLKPAPLSGDLGSVERVRAISAVVLNIKAQQQQDVEIEFGCQGDDVVVLQVRPLSVSAALPDGPSAAPPAGNWILDLVHYPRPLTPLYETIFAPTVSAVTAEVFSEYGVFARSIELRSIDGWPYVRVAPLSEVAAPSLPGALIGLIARIDPRLR